MAIANTVFSEKTTSKRGNGKSTASQNNNPIKTVKKQKNIVSRDNCLV
jgi:hypothetical protein